MSSQTRVWEIVQDALVVGGETALAEHHREAELESWIIKEPRLLGENLLIVAKQLDIPGVGRLDLLGLDASGKLVVVELKRDIATREAVAQALDYASWLDSASEEQVRVPAEAYLKEDLEDAYQSRFDGQLPKLSPSNHRIIVVAARPDDSTQRIIEYLAERHQMEINGVFFTFWKLSGGAEILVRTVLVPEAQGPTDPPVPRVDEAKLLKNAAERGVAELVKVFRTGRLVSPECGCVEEPASTSGGSFRYWKGRMLFGVNVSGQLGKASHGELTIWLRPEPMAGITGLSEDQIRERFSRFQPETSGRMDFVLRFKSRESAASIAQEIEQLLCTHPPTT